MRKTIVVGTLLVLVWLGYVVWPIYTLGMLARAIEAGDTATAMRHVDLPAVRRSITDQVVDTYLKLTGKTVSPLLRGAVASAADSIAEPIVGRIVAPDALAEFLREGWPIAVLPERPPGVSGLSGANLGNAWQVFAAAEYGIGHFEIELPPSLPRDRRIVPEFRIMQWRWQLVGVRMPDHLRVRLAEALIKLRKR
ncbi:MAG: DUF2939 domain-containing protein [Xanthobacteraceae bacterium]|nr:DUF2939 domain-containing protein [Xanthobacteraceae bacterium]